MLYNISLTYWDIEGLGKFATQCSSYVTILIGIKALEGFISPYQN
jgi:hypothetical protein